MFVMGSVVITLLLFMKLVMIQTCRQMMDAHQCVEFNQDTIASILPCLRDVTLFVEMEKSLVLRPVMMEMQMTVSDVSQTVLGQFQVIRVLQEVAQQQVRVQHLVGMVLSIHQKHVTMETLQMGMDVQVLVLSNLDTNV